MKSIIKLVYRLLLDKMMPVGIKSAPEVQARPIEATPRLLLLSAFDIELHDLLRAAKISETLAVNGRKYHLGRLAGHDVVLTSSGASMVNAAMHTQIAIDYFNLSGIVMSGIAGGVNPALKIGDVAVPSRWAQYQEAVFARQTAGNFDPEWFYDGLGNFGMMFPQPVSLTSLNGRFVMTGKRIWFNVDQGMLGAASQAARHVGMAGEKTLKQASGENAAVIAGGHGVSGPTVVNNAAYRQWVWERFDANVLDMESAAVVHVAHANNKPFIAFRAVSDLAGGGMAQNEAMEHFKLAADNAAAVVMAFLGVWKVSSQ